MYDDIVVGAGSAGAVMASRLSEDRSRKVLLIEAGPCFAGIENTPNELLDHDVPVLKGFNWNVSGFINDASVAETMSDAARSLGAAGSRFSMVKTAIKSAVSGNNVVGRYDCPVGRVAGGSSSVNGALALRALPIDFDAWVSAGCDEWSWQKVLPYFKAIETDLSHDNEWHGRTGYVPVIHETPNKFTAAQQAFYDACINKGYPYIKDMNGPILNGVGGFPKNIDPQGHRISSSLAYLKPDVLARDNLTVLDNTRVNKLEIEGSKVNGVEALVSGKINFYCGSRVILCSGFIHSPAILIRSGVGQEQELSRLGIAVKQVLNGVGQNLVDHPVATIWARPKKGVCPIGETTHQASLRYGSSHSNDSDMSLFMLSAFNISKLGELRDLLGTNEEAMAISAVLGAPASKGKLNFTSKDPAKSPTVCANLLKEKSDMQRMIEGVQLAWSIIKSDQMRDLVEFIPVWHEQVIDDDKKVAQILKSFVRGSNHAGGTLKMGLSNDENAVVDQNGKVFGIDNLFVADTSIMPETVRSSTNMTAMMIAEKVSESICR